MSNRRSTVNRETNETKVELALNIDGDGSSTINTGIPFFDHMLDLFSKHGLFDLNLVVKGDLEVDYHHTVEDIGICLGNAFREALGDAKSINRYASGSIPMDESLCTIAVDISGRAYLSFNADIKPAKVGEFDVELTKEFFNALVSNARITLHLDLVRGENSHHIIESCFKGLGVVLDRATSLDTRKTGVPSTKGIL